MFDDAPPTKLRWRIGAAFLLGLFICGYVYRSPRLPAPEVYSKPTDVVPLRILASQYSRDCTTYTLSMANNSTQLFKLRLGRKQKSVKQDPDSSQFWYSPGELVRIPGANGLEFLRALAIAHDRQYFGSGQSSKPESPIPLQVGYAMQHVAKAAPTRDQPFQFDKTTSGTWTVTKMLLGPKPDAVLFNLNVHDGVAEFRMLSTKEGDGLIYNFEKLF